MFRSAKRIKRNKLLSGKRSLIDFHPQDFLPIPRRFPLDEIDDESVYPFPDIGGEWNRSGIPVFVTIAEIICGDLAAEDRHAGGDQVLAMPPNQFRKDFPLDSLGDQRDMPKNDLIARFPRAVLGALDETSFLVDCPA